MNNQLNNYIREHAIAKDKEFMYRFSQPDDIADYSFVYRIGALASLVWVVVHSFNGEPLYYCSMRGRAFHMKYGNLRI